MTHRVKYITNMLHICNIFAQHGQNPPSSARCGAYSPNKPPPMGKLTPISFPLPLFGVSPPCDADDPPIRKASPPEAFFFLYKKMALRYNI